MDNVIRIHNARANNLKNVNLEIPLGQLIVICGISGSGKSSLVYDIIGKEGQRLFYENFIPGNYHNNINFNRAEADVIDGLPVVLVLNQHTHTNNQRSTVGTITGLWDLLRLLFARYAVSKNVDNASRSLFSFNSPIGQCPQCKGLGVEDHIDANLLVGDENNSLREGALVLTTPNGYIIYSQVTMEELNKVCEAEGFSVDMPWKNLSEDNKNVIFYGSDKIKILFGKHTLESRLKWSGITAKPREEGFYKGIIPVMEEILKRDRNPNILRFAKSFLCNSCKGTRLCNDAMSFKWENKTIDDFNKMSIEELHIYFSDLNTENEGLKQIVKQILKSTSILLDLGAGYLNVNRNSSSLSTGELNRLRLASYTVSGLRNILYVFDEPGAGLHDSEQKSLMKVLRRLVDNGNTVIVVDHHEKNIIAADYIVEIGPDAGVNGGNIIFSGKPSSFLSQNNLNSHTKKWINKIDKPQPKKLDGTCFKISNAELNNLKNISPSFYYSAFNVICGISGSGKTSLLNIISNQAKNIGFSKTIFIDAHPFGRSPRSNTATYTGLSDVLRDLFASTIEAKNKKFTKTHFSLAVPGGRCEDCQGAGLKQIGLHFLGNVEVLCESCGGKRFMDNVLEIRIDGKNMNDILNLSITEAHEFFKNDKKILKYTEALIDLGLGYVKLGQPSTTLSGGEAQRVKLASELIKGYNGNILFLLDEPAVGLHPHDVNNLISTFGKLINKGHTIIAVEHDLRMIATADFLCELGPESGKNGGDIVFSGTPYNLLQKNDTKTANALFELYNPLKISGQKQEIKELNNQNIVLKNVKTNNLDIDEIEFISKQTNIVCGPSGSGKSSLIFDTLFAASQNALMDGLSFRIRSQMKKSGNTSFDDFSGLMPTIALEKRSASNNPRSTVGTYTGIYDLYRLLYSRFSKHGSSPCSLYSNAFSFNNEAGACTECHGLGFITKCDPEKLISNSSKSLLDGAMNGSKPGKFYGESNGQYVAILMAVGKKYGIDFSLPYNSLNEEARQIAMYGCGDEIFDVEWSYKRKQLSGVHKMKSRWEGFCNYINDEYIRKHNDYRAENILPVMTDTTCNKCMGHRINNDRLKYLIANKNIGEVASMNAIEAVVWFKGLFVNKESEGIINEIIMRLNYLIECGIGYIALSRITSTLSGGEFQRLRMSALLQSKLSDVMIVIDEPSFGLGKKDCYRMAQLLNKIVKTGNTLVIADHNVQILQLAEKIKVLGPGSGKNGGRLIKETSSTEYISEIENIYSKITPFTTRTDLAISVGEAYAFSLKNINVDFYRETLNVIAGNSGSGKTSLLHYVIYNSFLAGKPVKCKTIKGFENLDSVVLVQQDVLTGSVNSIPASWLDIYDVLKNIFVSEAEKLHLPFKAQHFSLFSKEGRCSECGGSGIIKTSLDFRSDAEVQCETCNGARFKNEILQVLVNGMSIADVLNMSISEAAVFVKNQLSFSKARNFLNIAGLCGLCGIDYISLGQNLNTLSSGELQRLKIVQGIASAKGKTLFLLDEPSGGLHPKDTLLLLNLFDYILKQGNTIICASHDEMIIRAAANKILLD
jgi:excinuclease ABC subunit A